MLAGLFDNVTEADKNTAIEGIIQHATPRRDFFMMLMLSVSMASFGILLDSTPILIGSMLIAPILFPLLSLALGVIVTDEKIISQSLYTLVKSTGLALVAGFVIGVLFSGSGEVTSYVIEVARQPFSLMHAIVAAIAGFAAAFAMTKPYLNATLPGVAISVALVPPLAVAGVALSEFDWAVFSNSLLLFIVNAIGVLFSAMIVFALFQFAVKKNIAHAAEVKEERIVKKEEGTQNAEK